MSRASGALLDRDAFARALAGLGLPAWKVRAEVLARYGPDRAATGQPGATAGPSHVACELPPDAREATVQAAVLARLHGLGFRTWRVGQYVARGTQDPGVSDIIAVHRERPVIAFIECKRRTGGRWSEAQQEFAAAITAADGKYVLAHDPAVIDAWWRGLTRTEAD